MHSKVAFGVICFAVCAIMCENAPVNEPINEVSTAVRALKYSAVVENYTTFTQRPVPCKTVIPTRDLLVENVRNVQPIGVVLRRCPKLIPTIENWSCKSTAVEKVILQVRINTDGSGFKFHNIETEEDISCSCSSDRQL